MKHVIWKILCTGKMRQVLGHQVSICKEKMHKKQWSHGHLRLKRKRIENRFIKTLVYKQSFHITVHILSCSNQSLAYSTVKLGLSN